MDQDDPDAWGPRFKTSEAIFFSPDGIDPGFVFGLGYVFGFGAARWLPREGWRRSSRRWEGWRARIANLFNPFVPLMDGVSWLDELPEEEFERAETPLLRVLGRTSNERLTKHDGKVVLAAAGSARFEPLRELSDGYQTVLAIASEILQVTRPVFHLCRERLVQLGGDRERESCRRSRHV